MSETNTIEERFGRWLDLETPEARQQFLAETGDDDKETKKRLLKSIHAHEQAGSFLGGFREELMAFATYFQ